MEDSKLLKCYNCNSVILSLRRREISKLEGLNFQCECCGHENRLSGSGFVEAKSGDPYLNTLSVHEITAQNDWTIPGYKAGGF